jgi:hypothetical protein
VPQKLTQTPPGAGQALEVGGRPLTAAHEQLVGILRQRLGQNHGELFAAPRVLADGAVAWTTASAAPAVPAAQLPADERDKLEQRAERLLADIRGLAEQLRGEGGTAALVAPLLDRATLLPPGDWLYSVGGKPVLVMWGHTAPGAVPPPVQMPPGTAAAGASPAATAASGATGTAAVAADATASGSRRWPWLLAGVLLLAAGLWALRSCTDPTAADPALAEQLAQAEARNQALEEDLARRRAATPQLMCMAEAPPPPPPAAVPASAPPVDPPKPPPPAPAASAVVTAPPPPPAPPPNPLEELKRRVAAAGKNCDALSAMLNKEPLLKGNTPDAVDIKQDMLKSMEQNCREQAIKEARNQCPGVRPPELAPEMAIVFDASGSMRFSLDVTEEQLRQAGQAAALEGMMRQFGLGGAGPGVIEQLTREPRRISAAKRATHAVVGRLPADMATGLVLVEQCPAARSVGMFPPGQRVALLAQIQGIEPRSGTPLADGIARAGQLVDGVTREATIVVISDGAESCGGDPCAVAAALKRAKPYLTINVVDITGTGAGNCVAQITGGKVFTANNAEELAIQTERAVQDAMGPANCKR